MFAFVREHVLDMILAYFQSWKLDLKLAHYHFRKRSKQQQWDQKLYCSV